MPSAISKHAQPAQKKQKESGGVLDKQLIQAALGKTRPRGPRHGQRMWRISGNFILGTQIQFELTDNGHYWCNFDPSSLRAWTILSI
jgi:hypothetical protein